MDFWERIKDELEYKGLSQKEFAAKLGINIQTLRNSISINRLPDLETAYKMAQELQQPLEYFINGDVFPPNNFHLPTNEIELLTNYRKLNKRDKNVVHTMVSTMAAENHTTNLDIENNKVGLVADFDNPESN